MSNTQTDTRNQCPRCGELAFLTFVVKFTVNCGFGDGSETKTVETDRAYCMTCAVVMSQRVERMLEEETY